VSYAVQVVAMWIIRKKTKQLSKKRALLEPLSQRVLYSADPLSLQFGSPLHIPDLDDSIDYQLELGTETPRAQHIVFVDTSITEYSQIIDSLSAEDSDGISRSVYTLESSESISCHP